METDFARKINQPIFGLPRRNFIILLIFSAVSILVINLFLLPFVTPLATDSQGYLAVARFFRGQSIEAYYVPRLLKPLVSFLASLGSYTFDLKTSFLVVNSIFYLLVGFLVYKVIKLIFDDDRQALFGSLLYLASYPVLEYGIAYMTDLAG